LRLLRRDPSRRAIDLRDPRPSMRWRARRILLWSSTARPRRCDLRTTFGIEPQVLAFGHLNTFETGLYLLLDAVRRNNLAKHDPKLPIPPQPPRRPYLGDGTTDMAALRKKQMIRREQRLANDGFHRVALLCRS
jgi:hypothetical protein